MLLRLVARTAAAEAQVCALTSGFGPCSSLKTVECNTLRRTLLQSTLCETQLQVAPSQAAVPLITEPLLAVQLAAARLVSKRWVGLVEVPPKLDQALEECSGALGGERGRQLSNSSRRLIDSLRRNARTTAKGGNNATPAMDPGSGLLTRTKRVCFMPEFLMNIPWALIDQLPSVSMADALLVADLHMDGDPVCSCCGVRRRSAAQRR